MSAGTPSHEPHEGSRPPNPTPPGLEQRVEALDEEVRKHLDRWPIGVAVHVVGAGR